MIGYDTKKSKKQKITVDIDKFELNKICYECKLK